MNYYGPLRMTPFQYKSRRWFATGEWRRTWWTHDNAMALAA